MRRRSVLAAAATAAAAGTLAVVAGSTGSTAIVPTAATATAATALDPSVAPGGNFNLSVWELQLPTGSPGSPTTILPSQLKGASGYQNPAYFWTDKNDGSMTFWDPESGVTTANSNYPRSELREMNSDGTAANWALSGDSALSAELRVVS